MLLILQPTGIRGRKIRSTRVHWIKSVISTKYIEPDWYFRLLFLVVCGNSNEKKKKKKREIPPAVHFRCAVKTEGYCLFQIIKKKKNQILTIRSENITELNAEWLFVYINRTLLVSVPMFYMFIRGSSSFQKMPLLISLAFIHLLEDTGNGTAHFYYLQQSILFIRVGSDNWKKKQKTKSMPQCWKELLKLKKTDIIYVISSD